MRTTMTTTMSARIAMVRVFTEPPDEMVYRPRFFPPCADTVLPSELFAVRSTQSISAFQPIQLLRAVAF
jgi:hypothetical protein